MTKNEQKKIEEIYGKKYRELDIPTYLRNRERHLSILEEERREDLRFAERAERDAERERES